MATYIYENSNPERFQHLAQSMLLPDYPNLQCFPVAQSDGGRDATSIDPIDGETTVVQIKFKRHDEPAADTASWMIAALQRELPKVESLITAGAKRYIMVTNARGTAAPGGGGMDRVQSWMSTHISIPSQCLWRDDLDRRLDGNDSLKMTHPEILTGADALQLALGRLLHGSEQRQARTINSFLTYQYDRDAVVKFKQVSLKNELLSLFIDVTASFKTSGRHLVHARADGFRGMSTLEDLSGATSATEQNLLTEYETEDYRLSYRQVSKLGAASLLLHASYMETSPRTIVEGAPGQGKSTLSQYICQVHRARLLGKQSFVNALPADHRRSPVRLPIKVDLRDLASWLAGREPFLPEQPIATPPGWQPTLEAFLSHQISHQAGGQSMSIDDLIDIMSRMPVLLFLDGLDEVADISARATLIKAVRDGLGRLESNALSIQVVVTSRPSAFENSPGFSPRQFRYVTLNNLEAPLVTRYAEKWIAARELDESDAFDVRRILSEKLALPHIRDLSRNPMQLAILLTLIHSDGYSLPDQRTQLYSSYMDKFLTRETEKSPAVRRHRDLLVRIHQHLAWVLQTEAESDPGSAGSISPERLRKVMRDFLDDHGHPLGIIDELFTGALERVYVLVQRVQGAYEFEVQPLREFFCARYLYETAAASEGKADSSRGTRPRRFDVMVRNPYWTNVTRFYAGSYTSGENASLFVHLEEYQEDKDNALSFRPRQLSTTLLSDWAFKNTPRVVKKVVTCAFDDLGIRAAANGFPTARQSPPISLPAEAGQQELQEILMVRLSQDPSAAWASDIVQLLAANTSPVVVAWIVQKIRDERGTLATLWLSFALRIGALDGLEAGELEELVTHDGPSEDELHRRVSALLQQDVEAFKDAPGLTRAAVTVALNGAGVPSLTDDSWMSRFARATSAYFAVWRVDPNSPRFTRRADFREPQVSAPKTGMFPEFAFLEEIADLPDGLSDNSQWTTSLAPWNGLVEPLRRHMGESWAAYRIANIAAAITSASEKGAGASNLFDSDLPLAQRARYARHRSGQAVWWVKQLSAASTDQDRMFWSLLLLTWGSTACLEKLASPLSDVLQALDDDSFRMLFEAIESDYRVQERRLPRGALPPGGPTSSPRLTAVWFARYQVQAHDAAMVGRASEEPAARRMMSYRKAVAEYRAIDDLDAPDSLATIRRLYASADTRYAVDRPRVGRKAFRISTASAKSILAAPTAYPFSLIILAQRVLQATIRPARVGSVAATEGWTFE